MDSLPIVRSSFAWHDVRQVASLFQQLGVFSTVRLVIFVGQIFVVWEAQTILWVYIFVMYLL